MANYMGCRTCLQDNWTGDWEQDCLRTGNLAYVTLNLPRIGYQSKDESQVFEYLDEYMDLAAETLMLRREQGLKCLNDFHILPFLKQKVGEDSYYRIQNSTLSFGFVGLNEMLLSLFGNGIEDKDANKFGVKCIEYLNERADKLKEETGLLPVMQIGEIPSYSCLSYRSGLNSDCLLSCFDSNKKFLFIRKNGKVVFRAMIRLTKGSYVGDRMRKKIQFADLSGAGKPKEEEGEELVLFLERYYEKNLAYEEQDQAVYLAFVAAKEKAKKLGARLVLSCYYQDDVKTKEYIKSNYYLYISKSKNGSQYLDSLYGEASVSDSGDYSSNIFLLENKEQEVAA